MVLLILEVENCIIVLKTIESAKIVQRNASIVVPRWIFIVDKEDADSSARNVVCVACALAKETALLPQSRTLVAKMSRRI